MSTGAKVDSELKKGLTVAKSDRAKFAMVGKDVKGVLIVSKTKIPPVQITVAKKTAASTQVLEGECYTLDGKMVFEVDSEPSGTMAGVIKKIANDSAGVSILPVFKVVVPNQPPVNAGQVNNTTNPNTTKTTDTTTTQPNNSTKTTDTTTTQPNNTTGNNTQPNPTNTTDTTTTQPNTNQPNINQPQPSGKKQPQQYSDVTGKKLEPLPRNVAPVYATAKEWAARVIQVKTANGPYKTKIAAFDQLLDQVETAVKVLANDRVTEQAQKKNEEAVLSAARNAITQQRKAERVTHRQAQGQRDTVETNHRKQLATKSNVLDKKANETAKKINDYELPVKTTDIDAIDQATEADDSSIKQVTSAMRIMVSAFADLKKGKGQYAAFHVMVNKVRELAEAYKKDHKSPNSKIGKARVDACDQMLSQITQIMTEISENARQVRGIAVVIENLTTKNEVDARGVSALEKMRPFAWLDDSNKAYCEETIRKARASLAQRAQQKLAQLPDATGGDKAQVLLECGGAKPPSGKGQSDSFFINGTDGKPAYIFKSVQGEARATPDVPKGGGTAREVMASKLNDMFKADLGLDLGVQPTIAVQLEDEAFKQGSLSKDTKRTGALQTAIQLTAGEPSNGRELLRGPKGKALDKTELDRRVRLIPKENVDTVCMLDFITLNTDRHADNLMMTGTKDNPTLVPIDAGQSLPNVEFFKTGGSALAPNVPYNEANPSVLTEGRNLLLQLPQAKEKFSPAIQQKIADLDPDKVVAGMRGAYTEMGEEAPDMKNTVDDDSFDLMRKSMKFLKAAAPHLSLFDISKVYSDGFGEIVKATNDQELERAIQDAIADIRIINQAMANTPPNVSSDSLMGIVTGDQQKNYPNKLKARALGGKMDKQTFQQQHFVELQQELADIRNYIGDSGIAVTDELTRPYDDKSYDTLFQWSKYKNMGGDPKLARMLAGDQATYLREAAIGLKNKMGWGWKEAEEFVKKGGYEALNALLPASEVQALSGKPIKDKSNAIEKALEAQ